MQALLVSKCSAGSATFPVFRPITISNIKKSTTRLKFSRRSKKRALSSLSILIQNLSHRVDLGGWRIHLNCTGKSKQGSPTGAGPPCPLSSVLPSETLRQDCLETPGTPSGLVILIR